MDFTEQDKRLNCWLVDQNFVAEEILKMYSFEVKTVITQTVEGIK